MFSLSKPQLPESCDYDSFTKNRQAAAFCGWEEMDLNVIQLQAFEMQRYKEKPKYVIKTHVSQISNNESIEMPV